MMILLLSVLSAVDHKLIHQIEHHDVPLEYKHQIPIALVSAAIDDAATVRSTHLAPIFGQYTYTDFNPVRNILHCRILVDQI